MEWAHSLMQPNPTQARIPGPPNSTSAGAHLLTEPSQKITGLPKDVSSTQD